MQTWSGLDILLAAGLLPLLAFSAFFSAAETALFSLSENDRMTIRRSNPRTARAVESLLAQPRLLLITVLLGNMTVNTLYFVISSVLMLELNVGVVAALGLAIGTLLVMVLLGEMLPKTMAGSSRLRMVSLLAPPLSAFHRLISPLRAALDRFIVAPLSRLTAPGETPAQLSVDELEALLELSGRQGVIDAQEQTILEDVLALGRLHIRDVMTPRVRVVALPSTATCQHVEQLARRTKLTRVPVYDGDLDHILGVLNIKRVLAEPSGSRKSLDSLLSPPRFVPETATVDQLLESFRRTGSALAIVVDEYGGTAGIVAIEDVVREIVRDIAGQADVDAQRPRMIGINTWRVGGDVSVHDWADAFGQRLVSTRVATLGGMIFDRLGRAPVAGDVVQLSNVQLKVEQVDRTRVVSVLVILDPQDAQEKVESGK